MVHIANEVIISQLAEALQYISAYHPPDYIRHLTAAHAREESPAARAAIEQILTSSRLAALGHRAICQDTGTVNAHLKVGMGVRLDGDRSLQSLLDDAIRRAWSVEANPLRASIVSDPLFGRRNTRDNTPGMLTTELVPGDVIEVAIMSKGGGSENKSRFTTLRPSDSVEDWIIDQLPGLGAGWCPPGMLGIGVGGSADIAMRLAKESLYDPPDMALLRDKPNPTEEEALRIRLCDRANGLGIGAQGLGGLTVVLDVKLRTAPTHASALPVALIPQCVATRMIRFWIGAGEGFDLAPPDLSIWPEMTASAEDGARRVNLDTLTQADKESWSVGDTLLLSGHILTGRDAAHKRIDDMLARGEPLPVDLKDRAIYYVGPVDPAPGEVIGPAGPTTSTRMDKFTPRLLAESGLGLMIGKAERGPEVVSAVAQHKAPYLIAVGGAAVLLSRAIKSAKVVAFGDLGMEAIHEFEVQDMPVIVAVDCSGASVHTQGPAKWRS
ncbi:MAG: fumarate hydratase [Pseudomonadota bacterium]|nr:fumarate hydratase [Pseudomonadota bacterium]MEE2859701.1 fumarate hydratase [Pseudomonadota bacterium]